MTRLDKRWKVPIHVLIMGCCMMSCVEAIDLDPHEGRTLVVNCILVEGDEQTLEMYYTSGLSGEASEPIEDAEVTIESYDSPVTEFHRCDDGLWRADFRPNYGVTHHLKVFWTARVTMLAPCSRKTLRLTLTDAVVGATTAAGGSAI